VLGANGILRGGVVDPLEPPDQPRDVGVDGDPGHVEGVPQDDVRRLAPDTREGDEIVETARHLTVEVLDDGGGHAQQAVRLRAEEPRRADPALQVHAIGLCQRHGIGVLAEQPGRDGVHPTVGGLGGEHGGDEQLIRVGEVELAAGVGVGVGEDAVHLPRTAHEDRRRLGGLLGHNASVRGMTRL
jgi:hypothetical protein